MTDIDLPEFEGLDRLSGADLDMTAIEEELHRRVGRDVKGRFGAGNDAARARGSRQPQDAREAIRQAVTPSVARKVARRLLKIATARGSSDADALKAAELILKYAPGAGA